nr:disks large associated protein 5 [Hymenolepis microstoma]
MPRARRVSLVPTTPGGIHLRTADLSADEIVIDDEVVIRSSFFRGVSTEVPGTKKSPKRTPKYVVRKSTDLKKIKNIDDRIDAILASPMIENRRKSLGHSKSLETNGNERTPLRVPSSHDLQAVSSRRLSAIVMSKFAPYLHSASFTEGENKYLCPAKLNRRKTTGNFATPRKSGLSLGTPLLKNTPVTPDSKDLNQKLIDLDTVEDIENLPPPLKDTPTQEPTPSTSQPQMTNGNLSMTTVEDEPRSVGEFRVLVNMEISRLSALKAAWEDVMEEEGSKIPETAITHIRAAVGKCGLLIKNRLQTFFGLIDHTEESLRKQEQGDITELTSHQRSNINDLLGMWTNIARQISDIDKSFDRLRKWRDVSKWAYSSPPVTPAPPNKRQQKQVSKSRLPRPAWKSKGALKRLIPPASNTTGARQRSPKIAKRSNLAHIKAQMLAKKKASEGSGSTEIVIFGVGKKEGLPTPISGGRLPAPVSSEKSVPGSEGTQLVETSQSEKNVNLSPPVHESSHRQIDINAEGQAPKANDGNTVHEVSVGEECDVIKESIEIQTQRLRGRPRRSTNLGISEIGSEIPNEGSNLPSHKSVSGRPNESVGASKYFVMLGKVGSDVFTESRDVSPIFVEHDSASEKAFDSQKPRERLGKSSSLISRIEEHVTFQSPKRGRPRKSLIISESSMAQNQFEQIDGLQGPNRGTPNIQNADPEESTKNLLSPKPHGRPRKSSSVLILETTEVDINSQSPTLNNTSVNMAQEKNVEIQSPKRGISIKSIAAESIRNVNSPLPQENSELQSPKRGRPRKSTVPQSAEISQHIQSPGQPSRSLAVEVSDFNADELPTEQSFVIQDISSHRNSASRLSELVDEHQQLKSPKRRRSKKSTLGSLAVPETPLQAVDVAIDENAVVKRRGRPSRPSSLFVPDSQFPIAEEFTTLQSAKLRGRANQSVIINDSFGKSHVGPTPKRGRPRKSVVFDDSILAAERTPKRGRPRNSAVDTVEVSGSFVASAKQRGRPKKSVVDDSLAVNLSVTKQTPKRGRPRKSLTMESTFQTPKEVVEVASPVSSTKLRRPRRSTAVVQGTPSPSIESASLKRGGLSIISSSLASENFLIPDSLPRKRPRMYSSSALSTSHTSTVANTTNPFSPPPRPITGTPRPHMSKLMRTRVDSSLTQSVLRKQLILATTCGGNNSGRSSNTATVGLSQPNSGKRPVGRPRKSVRFLGSPDSQSSTKPSLPVTPHVRSSTDPNRRVSQRGRRPKHTP